MKTLAVGDLHFKEIYPYASKFKDGRLDERKKIEDTIIEAANDCEKVVLMGDVLDSRNNSSETIKNLTAFIERFGNKRVVIMGGNHEKFANGRCALDYLREIDGKNWLVVTNNIVTDEDGDVFVPFFRKQELGLGSTDEVTKWILSNLPAEGTGKNIFIHHCISGTKTTSGHLTDLFHEPVLPRAELGKKFAHVFGAHIHQPQDIGNVHVVGSVMNHEVGEHGDKRLLKFDSLSGEIEEIILPGRKFFKIENPTRDHLLKLKGSTIDGFAKVFVDEGGDYVLLEEIHIHFTGGISVIETPKADRKRVKERVTDFSLDNLLRIYSEVKEIDLASLKHGLELISK